MAAAQPSADVQPAPEDWDALDDANVRGGLGSLAARLGRRSEAESGGSSPDTPIPSDNLGHAMLRRMGWKPGSGLGSEEQGRHEPVRLVVVIGRGGLGIERVYDEQAKAATASRQMLESERQLAETPEEMLKRLERAHMQRRTREAVTQQNRIFFCEICKKQYSAAPLWEEHLSSYDHHHRKRMQETLQQDALRRAAARNAGSALTKRLQEEILQSQIAAAGGVDSSAPEAAAVGPPQSTILDSSAPRASIKLSFGALKGKKPLPRR